MNPDPIAGAYSRDDRIWDAIVRLTGRVDVLIMQHAEAQKDLTDHETRLRSLERARWPLPSLAALLAMGSLAVSLLLLLRP